MVIYSQIMKPTSEPALPLSAIGRLPVPGDNVAIATTLLPAGTTLAIGDSSYRLEFTVPEGHRFAVRPIARDEALLSWGLPFGVASQAIAPGEYVRNAGMIEALNGRTLPFTVPQQPNFVDRITPYQLDEATFQPGKQVERYPNQRTFLGYQRPEGRGVGTRNMVVILGATSSAAGFVRALAEQLQPETSGLANLDGIVPIAHTEGSGYVRLNNRDYLLRTLAGLMVHPNVAAVLAVNLASDPVTGDLTNEELARFMRENGYPLGSVLHHFFALSNHWQADLAQGAELVCDWLPQVAAMQRTPQPLSEIAVALQCGGSDAFSGVSGNPLAGTVAREIIRYGGRANLAETDELIGAESYILQNMRDLPTARCFLNFIAEFQERLAWHGQSAEGNPSGGNKLRGLYNIALKSIGAAMKKDPAVRIDHVIDYAERMLQHGFHFMNSPGNDLEGIAGQVASGANLIIFTTGNGSITNFPFVPTIKVMTTSNRFALLANEMDVNAGAYLDGTPMEELTQTTLDLLIAIASGQTSCGEKAGHSQISIWRNWQQQDRSRLPLILAREKPNGAPIPLPRSTALQPNQTIIKRLNAARQQGTIGLIVPTSICSGQIARLATNRLNAQTRENPSALSRFATLVHTEGCGVAFASTREIYAETMVGHALHPLVGDCLFLEHGCEKAHNNYVQSLIHQRGRTLDDFGWASVQLDGGIDKVLAKISDYFPQPKARLSTVTNQRTFAVAFLNEANEKLPATLAASVAEIIQGVVAAGGTAVLPSDSTFASVQPLLATLDLADEPKPSLAYGQMVDEPGFHLMEVPTPHWSETVTGLAATGVDLIVGFSSTSRPGHPFVPLLLVNHATHDESLQSHVDLALHSDSTRWTAQILDAMAAVVSGQQPPRAWLDNHIDFQLTRGWLGIST
ncbi:MAG: UxaA family hydrolase [Caldilineaceae bacterium]